VQLAFTMGRDACLDYLVLKSSFSHLNQAQAASVLIAFSWLLNACTPAFNWRDVGFDGLPLAALLPCKPERATRIVPVAGAPRAMVMAGCEAGGAMFTVAVVQLETAAFAAQAEAELKSVNQATHVQYTSRPSRQGAVLVQASVYGTPQAGRDGRGALSTQAVETFFSGVKLAGTP
jgi:hypothetical protein